MKDKLMQMMSEEKPSAMGEKDIQAKRDILKELLAECDMEMKGRAGRGLDEVKKMKVSVMADDPKSLKQGLEKAEELTEEIPEEMLEGEKDQDEVALDDSKKEDILEEAMEHDKKPMTMQDLDKDEDEEESFFQKKNKKKKSLEA
jgi:hypothetical protein